MRKWPHFCQHYFWQELDGIFSDCLPALHPGQPDWTHDQLFWRQQVWCCYRSQSHLTAGDNHYVSHCILHFYASVTNFICFFRFVTVSDSLPKSPKIKLVEIWLLFSLFQPFFDVLLQIYIFCQLEGSESEKEFNYNAQKSSTAWATVPR